MRVGVATFDAAAIVIDGRCCVRRKGWRRDDARQPLLRMIPLHPIKVFRHTPHAWTAPGDRTRTKDLLDICEAPDTERGCMDLFELFDGGLIAGHQYRVVDKQPNSPAQEDADAGTGNGVDDVPCGEPVIPSCDDKPNKNADSKGAS
eukprot:CAMPEP_0114119152 /NCGR_PEP_ID=MMETSP0043_2-20121206/5963_1 /TAXON_ID=464988 /ORGANISM="Hemiselmis andersenii, Strain CCMP644" /LENGTH=146 /DNA_ID=CAMNT_0001211689 /DNA_START=553 /DNA_END=993 /DNA_ORIENTATION=-